jgi:hypothetical protein
MADFVFNRCKGRVTELAERVNANDPTNSVFLVALVASTGVETDAVLRDKDDFAGLVSGTTDFATNTGSGRKTLDQTGGITVTYDDTNDRVDVDIPDQTWTALANDGTGGISDLVTGYDSDSTGGTDAGVLPMTFHDFAVTPDGSDVTAQIATAGFYRAS